MKRMGLISILFVGFIAGIAFVYSCGGGGGGNELFAGTGDADLLDGLDSTDYAYSIHSHTVSDVAGTQIRYLSVPAVAFVSRDDAIPRQVFLGNGGAYISTTGSGALVAPVILPDGATVTNVTSYIVDDAAGNMSVALMRRYHLGGGFDSLSTSTTSGASGDLNQVDVYSVDINHIFSASYGYALRAYSVSWPGDLTLRVSGVLITYEVNGIM